MHFLGTRLNVSESSLSNWNLEVQHLTTHVGRTDTQIYVLHVVKFPALTKYFFQVGRKNYGSHFTKRKQVNSHAVITTTIDSRFTPVCNQITFVFHESHFFVVKVQGPISKVLNFLTLLVLKFEMQQVPLPFAVS